MRVEEFDFNLPNELIAQYPLPRGKSRLLYLPSNGTIIHTTFANIVNILSKNDVVIANDSKVIPARIRFSISDKKYEMLLIKRLYNNVWKILAKPARKFRKGLEFEINPLKCKVIGKDNEYITVEFSEDIENHLESLGEIPLPPYIKRLPTQEDKSHYQTVYAQKPGSIAAPTAGLHFSKQLVKSIKEKAELLLITLHVGPGTFRPVRTEQVEHHKMDKELFSIDEETAYKIREYKLKGYKIVAVGTTTVRALESCFDKDLNIRKLQGYTDLFIYPGYKFKVVDKLITNFHLPRSSLLMLVSAFINKEKILKAYSEAIKLRYRFYSYGDAMFIEK